jgi:hypothetical protein
VKQDLFTKFCGIGHEDFKILFKDAQDDIIRMLSASMQYAYNRGMADGRRAEAHKQNNLPKIK